jgi:MFS family permease
MKWVADDLRPLVPLYLVMFLDSIGSGIVTILSIVAKQDLGCSNFEVGMIWTGFNAAQIVGSITMGYLSDRISRKYVLGTVLAWIGSGYLFTAFANTFTLFLISRIFTGLCGGSFPIIAAILSTKVSPDRFPVAIGRLGTVASLGFAIGPLLSGAMTAIFDINPSSSPFYIQRLYFFAAAFVYWSACALALWLPARLTPAQSCDLKSNSKGWLTSSLALVWLSRFFATCGVTAVYVTQVYLWDEFLGLSRVGIELTVTASGLTVSAVQGFLFPWLVSKTKSFHGPFALGILLIAVSNIVIGPITLTGSAPLHYFCLVVFWVGIGLMEPGAPVAVTRHLDQSKRIPIISRRPQIHTGFAMGMTSAMKYAASLAIPMAAGYMFDHYNVLTYYMSGGIAFAGVVTVVIAWNLFRTQEILEIGESVSTHAEIQEKSLNV